VTREAGSIARSAAQNISAQFWLNAKRIRKEAVMDDMPMWMKLLIWIVVGGTVLYTITSVIISAMG
jgi:hypothetical protein